MSGHDGRTSYREAFKAGALTGSSSLVQVMLQMVRAKVIAVTLGPAGIGMFGVLTSITGLVASLAGMGINGSGVRQVSAASASGDDLRIARVVLTLRRTSIVLGVLGTLVLLILADPITRFTTGSTEYTRYLIILAPLVLFSVVRDGQAALLRGLRKTETLARISILGAVYGTLISIPLVLLFGIEGIPPAMLLVALAALATTWIYARKIQIERTTIAPSELWGEAVALFSLGLVFLSTSLQTSAVQYALRAILLQFSDLDAVGQFLAATTLSHVYANFILQAMGLDYMPRLTRLQNDAAAGNRLVNEQCEIGLLFAGPGLVALTVLAPILIPAFYSNRFQEAVDVFQWQCLGVLLKVPSWAIGGVLIARNRRGLFLVTETIANLIYLGAFSALTAGFSLMGAAAAYAVLYLLYFIMIYLVVHRETGFRFSPGARRLLVVMSGFYVSAAAIHDHIGGLVGAFLGMVILSATAYWSFRQLENRLEVGLARELWGRMQKLLLKIRAHRPLR